MVVGNMHQGAHPQLHLTEDARKAPHILIFQITAIAPTINLDSQFVLTFMQIPRHIKLGRRHGILTIAHLLSIQPNIHRRMDTTEMQNKIL